jgi:hypothetical protein
MPAALAFRQIRFSGDQMRMPGHLIRTIRCCLILIAALVSAGLITGCEPSDPSLLKIDLVQKAVYDKSLSTKILDNIAYAVSEDLARKAHANFGPDMDKSVAWMEYWGNAQWRDFAASATTRGVQTGTATPGPSSVSKYGIDIVEAQVWIEFYCGADSVIPENERSRVAYAELKYRDGWQVVKIEEQAGVLNDFSYAFDEKGLKRSSGK